MLSSHSQPAIYPTPPLDTRLRVETPEGIELTLRPAGIFARSQAYLIDLCMQALILFGLALLSMLLSDSIGSGLWLLGFFLIDWLYMATFEYLYNGQSPGKRLLRLRVVRDDGTPLTWGAALIRNLLRAFDMLPVGYGCGLLFMIWHPRFKRVGDCAAGTLVIHVDPPAHPPQLPDANPLLAPLPLTLSEQQAILAFAERHEHLSSERRTELAAVVITAQDETAPPPELYLYALAQGMIRES